MKATLQRISQALNTPCHPAGLAAFRILFGALMTFAVVRFAARGWIDELYIAPEFHFTYLGFDWVRPWPGWGMYAHFAIMGLSAFTLTLGAFTRMSAAVFLVTFTYAELLDKTAYLNHYYLVSLLAFLLIFVPAQAIWSVDAYRARQQPASVGRWSYILLCAQVGVVYVFAGLAKVDIDWLFHAEPLRTWLAAHGDLPIVGPYLAAPWTAYAMSWVGAIYDLTIVGWLLWRKSRRLAYVAAIAFHMTIWLLFPVGVFSWVMLVSTTLFFDPRWPRWPCQLIARIGPGHGALSALPTMLQPARQISRKGITFASVFVLVQVLVPLRFLLYPGNVNWTEEGFRFSWRVMLVEKTGQVEFTVLTDSPERRYTIFPRADLTPLQYKMMVTQPDMIHEYALHIAKRFRRQGHERVRIHAKAWAALNGRPSQRLVDPSVDLASQPRSLRPSQWIVHGMASEW